MTDFVILENLSLHLLSVLPICAKPQKYLTFSSTRTFISFWKPTSS